MLSHNILNLGNIITLPLQDAANFRSVMRQVGREQLATAETAGAAAGAAGTAGGTAWPAAGAAGGRTEVLPVQWRKQLALEIDSLSALLMPPGVRALREVRRTC